MDHLHKCRKCARDFRVTELLHQFLETAGVDDRTDIVPLLEQRKLVEARAANTGRTTAKTDVAKTAPVKKLMRRLLPAYGTIAAVILLVLLTLVPFRYDHTVGYEISFDGVNKEFADDVNRICDMLFALGLEDADVDVLGCDTTCSLMIVDLKSREEVQLVIAAFGGVDHDNLKTNIIPIRATAKRTLLDQANESLLRE